MLYAKRAFWTSLWVLVFAFLHYTLPQQDIARVVGVENRRIDFGENSIFWAGADTGQDSTAANRDVRFINTVRKKTYLLGLIRGGDDVMVYRNEDTGWGWPPYFKLDSSNLQTEAEDAKSSDAEPKWYVITHYGWRNEVFSIFPNAVGIRPIDNPDKRLIPWVNIFLLLVFAGLLLGLYRLTQWFKRRNIDPIIEDAGEAWNSVDGYADEKRKGVRAWLDTWRGKPRQ
jgi:hypothetical protein